MLITENPNVVRFLALLAPDPERDARVDAVRDAHAALVATRDRRVEIAEKLHAIRAAWPGVTDGKARGGLMQERAELLMEEESAPLVLSATARGYAEAVLAFCRAVHRWTLSENDRLVRETQPLVKEQRRYLDIIRIDGATTSLQREHAGLLEAAKSEVARIAPDVKSRKDALHTIEVAHAAVTGHCRTLFNERARDPLAVTPPDVEAFVRRQTRPESGRAVAA